VLVAGVVEYHFCNYITTAITQTFSVNQHMTLAATILFQEQYTVHELRLALDKIKLNGRSKEPTACYFYTLIQSNWAQGRTAAAHHTHICVVPTLDSGPGHVLLKSSFFREQPGCLRNIRFLVLPPKTASRHILLVAQQTGTRYVMTPVATASGLPTIVFESGQWRF